MRLVKPMSMFTNSLIGYGSVFFLPPVDGGRAWKLVPKLSGSPSCGGIGGDGGVRWPKDAWAASTVTSWSGSSYVPGKPGSQGRGIRSVMKSIPSRLTKQTRQKARSSSFAHGGTSKTKTSVGRSNQKLFFFFLILRAVSSFRAED